MNENRMKIAYAKYGVENLVDECEVCALFKTTAKRACRCAACGDDIDGGVEIYRGIDAQNEYTMHIDCLNRVSPWKTTTGVHTENIDYDSDNVDNHEVYCKAIPKTRGWWLQKNGFGRVITNYVFHGFNGWKTGHLIEQCISLGETRVNGKAVKNYDDYGRAIRIKVW